MNVYVYFCLLNKHKKDLLMFAGISIYLVLHISIYLVKKKDFKVYLVFENELIVNFIFLLIDKKKWVRGKRHKDYISTSRNCLSYFEIIIKKMELRLSSFLLLFPQFLLQMELSLIRITTYWTILPGSKGLGLEGRLERGTPISQISYSHWVKNSPFVR